MLSVFSSIDPFVQPLLLSRPTVGLHAMIVSAGYECASPGSYDWHGLRRGKAEFALLQYTLRGKGSLKWEGKSYEVPPGTAMCLHFPHDNRYWLPPDGEWEYFFLCLNGQEVVRLWRAATQRVGPLMELSESSPLLQSAVSTCLRVQASHVHNAWEASTLAYDLAIRLAERALPGHHAPSRAQRPAPIQAAIEFCRENLAKPIGVEDLADAAGLSRYHFTRVFRSSVGIAPGEFLARQRMRQAGRLLQDKDLPVKQVALACGFQDASYFCKAFRKAFGVSPGAYRRSGMV